MAFHNSLPDVQKCREMLMSSHVEKSLEGFYTLFCPTVLGLVMTQDNITDFQVR